VSYISEAELKESLTLSGTTFADDDLARACQASNAAVEQLLGRSFTLAAAAATRYYGLRHRGRSSLEIDDLTRTTTITVAVDTTGDGTFNQTLVENTDFVLEPLNAEADGVPFERVRLLLGYFPFGPRCVSVQGTFGWPSVPPQISAFAAVLATKLVTRFRDAPFGIVTAGADMGIAMRLARSDPDFPTLSAGLCRGVLIS
jgi:hypothetical protein